MLLRCWQVKVCHWCLGTKAKNWRGLQTSRQADLQSHKTAWHTVLCNVHFHTVSCGKLFSSKYLEPYHKIYQNNKRQESLWLTSACCHLLVKKNQDIDEPRAKPISSRLLPLSWAFILQSSRWYTWLMKWYNFERTSWLKLSLVRSENSDFTGSNDPFHKPPFTDPLLYLE